MLVLAVRAILSPRISYQCCHFFLPFAVFLSTTYLTETPYYYSMNFSSQMCYRLMVGGALREGLFPNVLSYNIARTVFLCFAPLRNSGIQ